MDNNRDNQECEYERMREDMSEPKRTSPYYRELPNGNSKMLNFTTPPQPNFDNEEMRGSMQHILSENIGEYVVVEFLIGTELIVRKQGILYFVGRSYVTLYDDVLKNFIVCDIFSVKFVYFYLPGDRPRRNFNNLPQNSIGTANRNYRNDR
ncbi:hypothetical protein [Candidatus Soleaferrea massiliensis]|uniref:hypothetical protein n=1 Tax=Candidatus Soleaferrea massiliensis TaxID=1470354 RepID=UPI00058CE999|nr:hypothetical protein [Candidatus Soleaferrea massiliensis]